MFTKIKTSDPLAACVYNFSGNCCTKLDVNVPVDVIVDTPERFNELKDNPFLIYNEIAKYGRVVYEK